MATAMALIVKRAAALLRQSDVAVGHRGGDPHDLAVRRQAGQRGHEAAAAARERAVDVERHRAAVGDEDEGNGLRHGVSVPRPGTAGFTGGEAPERSGGSGS